MENVNICREGLFYISIQALYQASLKAFEAQSPCEFMARTISLNYFHVSSAIKYRLGSNTLVILRVGHVLLNVNFLS